MSFRYLRQAADEGLQLFSASAVMESRASTQLGENIKLLTFVSIFFLPLTFCTVGYSLSYSDHHFVIFQH